MDRTQNAIENAWLRVVIGPDGSLGLTDKAAGVTYPDLGVFEDGGDAGDTYNYSYPPHDRVVTSRDLPAEIQFLEAGPLRARAQISVRLDLPDSLAEGRQVRSQASHALTLVTVVTVEAGSPLVRFHTRVHNTVKDHRLRVLFPTGLLTDFSQAETQFDVVARPITPKPYDDAAVPLHVRRVILGAREPQPATSFPQRAFVDLSDGQRGLAVLNQGLPEYEILPENRTIALTLWRSVGWLARPDLLTRSGDAGPLIAVPGAQCLRTMEFEYALFAHTGGWEAGGVLSAAERFSRPILTLETGAHAGPLATSGGFFNLVDPTGNLKATAFKHSEDGLALVIRLHNPSSAAVSGAIETTLAVRSAWTASLNEDPRQQIDLVEPHTVPFSVPPKVILTLRLELERPASFLGSSDLDALRIQPGPPKEEVFSEERSVYPVSAQEIADEVRRAAGLEALLAEKEAQFSHLSQDAERDNPTQVLESCQLQLEVASLRRTALEARLSELLLKKNYGADNGVESEGSGAVEPALRQIGDAINVARVSKRALEYVVDYYVHQAHPTD